jgi:acyl dehydratase
MPESVPNLSFSNLEEYIGEQIALSEWQCVPQNDVVAFGTLTHDPDPMHVDPAWAREHSPYGKTVLAGLHILTLLPLMTRGSGLNISGVELAMNYGFDRIRFISPIPVGASFRNRVRLLRVGRRPDGKASLVTRNSLEVRGEDRPAMVAEWVNLLWPLPASTAAAQTR